MRRHSLLAALTVLISTFGCLFLAEQALNWHAARIQSSEKMDFGLIRYHAIRGWQLTSNWEGEHRHYDYSVHYATDDQGFRKPSPEVDKGQTVALVGDSFTFGLGVDDAETFTAQLNRLDPSRSYLNFGVPGYSTDQQLLLLESEILARRPDIVVLFFYLGNDLLDNMLDYPLQAAQAKPFFTLDSGDMLTLRNTPVPQVPKPAKLQSTAFRTIIFGNEFDEIEPWWASIARSSQILRLLIPDQAQVRDAIVDEILTTRLDKQKRLTAALVASFTEQVTASGARLIIAPLPGRSFVDAPDSYSAIFQEHVRNFVASLADDSGLPVIDVARELQANYDDDAMLFHPNEGHFTAEGHAAVARIVLASMTK